MRNWSIYASRLTPPGDNFTAGHRACIGCAEALAVRLACKAIGDNVIISNATGCMEIVSSQLPTTAWRVPWIHTLFENTAATASGVEAALKALERKGKRAVKGTKVVAMAGDGGTSDIGLQALSGAMERYHDFVYICFDNEAYMNTGIQRSSQTPSMAWTTTSLKGKEQTKKDLPAIMAAHGIPYVATATVGFYEDLTRKLIRARDMGPGFKYIHVLSPCAPGWRFSENKAIELSRLAVETGLWILYEVDRGKTKITYRPKKLKPVEAYLSLQGRFSMVSPKQISEIQKEIDSKWKQWTD